MKLKNKNSVVFCFSYWNIKSTTVRSYCVEFLCNVGICYQLPGFFGSVFKRYPAEIIRIFRGGWPLYCTDMDFISRKYHTLSKVQTLRSFYRCILKSSLEYSKNMLNCFMTPRYFDLLNFFANSSPFSFEMSFFQTIHPNFTVIKFFSAPKNVCELINT